MKRQITRVLGLCVVLSFVFQIEAQRVATSSNGSTALPRLVRFSGTARDINGNPLTGVVGITFALYSDESGGAAAGSNRKMCKPTRAAATPLSSAPANPTACPRIYSRPNRHDGSAYKSPDKPSNHECCWLAPPMR